MSTAQTQAEADIDAAITEAVDKAVPDVGLRRSITQFLIGAHKELPPEERTSSLIDTILETMSDEDR